MPNLINTNIELIESVKENIKDPLLVLDQHGIIHSFNTEASDFFSFTEKSENLYEFLEQSSAKKIDELFQNIFQKNLKIEEGLVISLKNGKSFEVQFTASPLIVNNERFVLCLFKNRCR